MLKRWLAVVALLLAVGAGAWFGLPQAQKNMAVGDTIRTFTLPDMKGAPQTLPQGQPMLVNFWATWCPPCRQEMPDMIRLYHTYQKQGLKIVAVSVDENSTQLHDFVTEYQVPFEVLNDADSAVSSSYGVFRYPETFLVDKHGVVQAHLIGAIAWMSPKIRADIEALLADKPLHP